MKFDEIDMLILKELQEDSKKNQPITTIGY